MTPDDNKDARDRNLVGQTHARGAMVPRDWPVGPYHLLAIGIDRYAHWNRLKTAKAGADAVRETLIQEFGFAAAHCTVLHDDQATGAAIIAALRSLARTLPEDASLLLYFAGHGHIDDLTRLGWWILVAGTRPTT